MSHSPYENGSSPQPLEQFMAEQPYVGLVRYCAGYLADHGNSPEAYNAMERALATAHLAVATMAGEDYELEQEADRLAEESEE